LAAAFFNLNKCAYNLKDFLSKNPTQRGQYHFKIQPYFEIIFLFYNENIEKKSGNIYRILKMDSGSSE
jgi:hypothetical protein